METSAASPFPFMEPTEERQGDEVLLADDYFLGSTVDIVDENSLSICSDDEEICLTGTISNVKLEGDRMGNPFQDDTLDEEEEAVASGSRKKIPKFQMRIRPEDNPGVKRGRGRPAKQQKSLVYLKDLPDAKRRRGPRGPYKKRLNKFNARPKVSKRLSRGGDGGDGMHLLEKRPIGRPRLPDELRRSGGQSRDKAKREKMLNCVEIMRRIVPGLGAKTDKASVITLAAQYVLFLKKQVGIEFDGEFAMAREIWTTWASTMLPDSQKAQELFRNN